MKKLINNPLHVVPEMLDGLLAVYPGLARIDGYPVIVRADLQQVRDRQVALISGGGSGHEPAHAGFVGAGMLSAAVAGEVFTSPSSDSVLAAIRTAAGKLGALLIVKNYTGDRLNFGLAAEIARSEGIKVELVVVADDVATAYTQENTGARGIAGTVLVHKIAGAAAAEGRSLSDVTRIARETAAAVATMGVSLSSGIVPAVGKPSFELSETEVELGLGIHGEPGVERTMLVGADALTERLLDEILKARDYPAGEPFALLINNLGSTTPMELAIVARRAAAYLRSHGIQVLRFLCGTLMTSLEMAGVSLSLLRLNGERSSLLDADTAAPAWPRVSEEIPSPLEERTFAARVLPAAIEKLDLSSADLSPRAQKLQAAIQAACQVLIAQADYLTELDRAIGDGDLGITLARGAKAVLQSYQRFSLEDISETLKSLGKTLQQSLGGSSGPLYGVLFLKAGNELSGNQDPTGEDWAHAIGAASEELSMLGGAVPGEKTMLDALHPFVEAFSTSAKSGASAGTAFQLAIGEAEQGAERTRGLMPRRGRASYLGQRAVGQPDPGAIALALWLRGVADAIR